MKLKSISLIALLFFVISFSGCQKNEIEDDRKLVSDPINPNEQPNDLNNALIIYGELVNGNLPASQNPELIDITVSVPSAVITNDNFLFLPFAFDLDSELTGMYLQVEGAQGYWDAPIDLVSSDDNSFAIAIGIPPFITTGQFTITYQLYDMDGNISFPETIYVSIVPSENSCGNGQGFPRVEGSDGITVRTYDFGDVPGKIYISYYMYIEKDRMDIRYNNQWIRSTSPVLLEDGQAPPFKTCLEATPNEGFVSGGDTFEIDYDPSISRTISIYVSGCLQGGTLWYFDVDCPDGSNTQEGSVCDLASAQIDYNPNDEKYHKYPKKGDELTTVICDPDEDPNCTIASVYQAMLSQSNFIAPTSDTLAVTDCKITWVEYLPGDNPVVTKLDASNHSITNYTLSNYKDKFGIAQTHFLHPGKVTRTVKKENDMIVVCTEGEGTGDMVWANEHPWSTGLIWEYIVDGELKDYWDSK